MGNPAPAAASRPWQAALTFLSGAVSSTCSAALLQPFDVIRTYQQGRGLTGIEQSPERIGLRRAATVILSQRGLLGFWDGLTPTVARVFFGAGIYFTALTLLSPHVDRHATGRAFVVGTAARCVAACVMAPVTLIKTRMEYAARSGLEPPRMAAVVVDALRRDGVRGAFAGLMPTILRDAPFSGVYYAAYTYLRPREAGPIETFATGFVAGCFACVITQPADVLRTRLQLETRDQHAASPRRMLTAVYDIARVHGLSGFFIGGAARIWKRSISAAVTWSLFEQATKRPTA